MNRSSPVIAVVIGVGVCVVIFSVVLAVLVARGRSSATVASTPSASASASASAEVEVPSSSVAEFDKEGILQCTDFPGTPREKLAAALAKDLGKNETVMAGSCDDAFADRDTLATCTRVVSAERTGAKMSVSTHYYNALKLENDAAMKKCLKDGGDWSAAARTSDEWRRSRHRGHVQQLEHLSEQLQKGPQ